MPFFFFFFFGGGVLRRLIWVSSVCQGSTPVAITFYRKRAGIRLSNI